MFLAEPRPGAPTHCNDSSLSQQQQQQQLTTTWSPLPFAAPSELLLPSRASRSPATAAARPFVRRPPDPYRHCFPPSLEQSAARIHAGSPARYHRSHTPVARVLLLLVSPHRSYCHLFSHVFPSRLHRWPRPLHHPNPSCLHRPPQILLARLSHGKATRCVFFLSASFSSLTCSISGSTFISTTIVTSVGSKRPHESCC